MGATDRGCWSRAFQCFIVSALAAGVPSAMAATVHPVPLQSSECGNPAGSAGLTGHALFEYRIEATGTVQGVKLLYADVQPEARKQGYVAEVKSCLEKWKFRPATVD